MAQRAKPTLTAADRRAARVRVIIEAAAARIPGLMAPHAKTSRRIRGHRTVPRKFIRSAMAAVEAAGDLQRATRFDLRRAEGALQFEAAFRPVADQLATLLASLTYTIDMAVAKAAEDALRTYAVAKGLARDGQDRQLQIRLAHLKRDLGRKGPRKKE